ncbi:Hypothetical predicted protein [Mytilus galloprovincialis]|uniref:Reverse transcriptase zinc-binding domain-containing protein n=1 Tax=Mytilus galloprovincialis TaxID=29158 RepID=A0A8B6DXL3_MYTGA|nr:Hypothetical predicted protein [Mytilus galloprovincialis]
MGQPQMRQQKEGLVYIKYPNGDQQSEAIPTGLHCSNYKAEEEALTHAAHSTKNQIDNTTQGLKLRTGHKRLHQHLRKVMKVVPSPMCPCGEAEQDTAHLLQSCKIHLALRNKIWHSETPLTEKLYGPVDALQKTTRFVEETGIQV